MRTVGIIGMGALGKRHLEAVYKVHEDLEIYGMDINPNAMDGFAEPENNNGKKYYTFCTSLDGFPEELDVVIISTSSGVRRKLFDTLLEAHRVKTIIFEKVLFQRIEDYYYVGERLKLEGITAYVNTPKRMFQGYKWLKDQMKEETAFEFHLSGGEWGLGCNLVHMLDLIEYLDGGQSLEITQFNLEPEIVESKRAGYKELYGSVSGKGKLCKNFTITCFRNSPLKLKINIATPKCEYVIEEYNNKIQRIMDGVAEEKDIGVLYTSQSTTIVLEDLLHRGECDLPSYKESKMTHLLFIKEFTRFFENQGMERGICPIT